MKYFLAQDNSGHWYLVDALRRSEWDAWCDLDEDDENGWDPPSCARRLDGGPQYVVFENPEQQ